MSSTGDIDQLIPQVINSWDHHIVLSLPHSSIKKPEYNKIKRGELYYVYRNEAWRGWGEVIGFKYPNVVMKMKSGSMASNTAFQEGGFRADDLSTHWVPAFQLSIHWILVNDHELG